MMKTIPELRQTVIVVVALLWLSQLSIFSQSSTIVYRQFHNDLPPNAPPFPLALKPVMAGAVCLLDLDGDGTVDHQVTGISAAVGIPVVDLVGEKTNAVLSRAPGPFDLDRF